MKAAKSKPSSKTSSPGSPVVSVPTVDSDQQDGKDKMRENNVENGKDMVMSDDKENNGSGQERDSLRHRSAEKSASKSVSFEHLNSADPYKSNEQKKSTQRKGFGIHRGKLQTSVQQTG